MKYTYFVSYSHDNGFGMIEIFSDNKVETFDDVLNLASTVKKKNGLDVVILNWKRLN